jgi:hypothetical protein
MSVSPESVELFCELEQQMDVHPIPPLNDSKLQGALVIEMVLMAFQKIFPENKVVTVMPLLKRTVSLLFLCEYF